MSLPRLAPPLLLAGLATLLPRSAGAVADRLAWSMELGTSISELDRSPDGAWVAAVEAGTGAVWFLDTRSWELTAVEACSGSSAGGVAMAGSDGEDTAWVGCADGTLVPVSLGADGSVGAPGEPVTVADGAVRAVEADGETVYVVAEQADAHDAVHLYDASTGSVDPEGWGFPTTLNWDGFEDSALPPGYLVVAHGGDDISKVDLSTGAVSSAYENLAGREMVDIACWNSEVLLADRKGGVIQFMLGDNDFAILLDDEDGLGENTALSIDAEGPEPALLVYDESAGEVVVFPFDTSSGYPDDEVAARIEAEPASEMVSVEGYTLAGGSTGVLQLFTELPWITVDGLSPSSAADGDEVSLSFHADTGGSWALYLGGGVEDWDGTLLDSGELEAETTVTSTFTVDDAFAEGTNRLWIRVEYGGLVGHAGASLVVDNPPSRVDLSGGVGFGDQEILLSFDGIGDEDLDHYVVYLAVTPFEASDYPSGGPEWDGEDELSPPFEISAEPGEHVDYTISPVTNGQTYYVAVRAVDAGGKEGPMSQVVSVVPQETASASELAGEAGGCASAGDAGLLAALLALLGLAGRRRPRALLLALLAAPVAARAAEDEAGRAHQGSLAARYGPWSVEDEAIQAVYGEQLNLLFLEAGRKLGRLIEFRAGAGFLQDKSTTVSVDGSAHSGEPTRLRSIPLAVEGAFRLDVVEEQVLVPELSAGLDYWLWDERWAYDPEEPGSGERLSGGKAGWHWAASLGLLLDVFDRAGANELYANTGFKDTYVVAEYREQRVGLWDEDGGLTFDGKTLTFGLKLDF